MRPVLKCGSELFMTKKNLAYVRMDLRRLKTELCIQDELLHTLARNLDNEMIMSIITIGCTRV